MKQKIIFFITLLILVNLKAFSLENVNIVFKIDEEIITNIDVKKEAKFLVALNTNLETLNEKKLTDLAKKSIIKETIKKTALTALEITEIIYTDIDSSLIPAATRNVFAHLIDLNERGQVAFQGDMSEKSKATLKHL